MRKPDDWPEQVIKAMGDPEQVSKEDFIDKAKSMFHFEFGETINVLLSLGYEKMYNLDRVGFKFRTAPVYGDPLKPVKSRCITLYRKKGSYSGR